MERMMLGDTEAEIVLKDIKNVHLSVYPPNGRVRVSAPQRMHLETLRVYLISKLPWIRAQQEKLRAQAREAARDYVNRETHFYLGRRYQMRVIELATVPVVNLRHDVLELYVRPGSDREKRAELLERWHREQLRGLGQEMIRTYAHRLGVAVPELRIKKMKTKWGTCQAEAGRIWLNLDLIRKPVLCIEYIVLHEMVHLLERRHNARFTAILDQHMPLWRERKAELNRLPVGHVAWEG